MRLKPIQVGKLCYRVQVYSYTTSSNGRGGKTKTAQVLATTLWAGIKTFAEKRVDDLGREHQIGDYLFTFRTESINPYITKINTHKLRYDSIDYKITEIVDEDLKEKLTTVKAVRL